LTDFFCIFSFSNYICSGKTNHVLEASVFKRTSPFFKHDGSGTVLDERLLLFSDEQLIENEMTGLYPLNPPNMLRVTSGDSGVTSGDFSESRQLSQAWTNKL
jgi:hypothetical protein